ncbi:MAG: tricarboxylate transport rane protein [Deltaproteobacteria bacterium]|nr:tricarboxylate transport rane protein [Deltaproteobacteria bacterium]
MIEEILHGFSISLTWANVFYCFLGVLVGTLVGILPGLGPSATISLLLPTTFYLGPTPAIIVLAGVYYGAMYGGSTTSILVNIPGEAASVVTCLDGYQMARNGKAGPALGISAFGSFIAGTVSVVGLMIFAPPLAKFALRFGPPEYFALIFMAFSLVTYLASGDLLKAIMAIAMGVFIGTIGMDFVTGEERFSYGSLTLSDGLGLVPVVMGLFGVAEVLHNLEQEAEEVSILQTEIKNLLPNLAEWKASFGPILRGTVVGFILGVLPGGGSIMGAFASYVVEKKVSKHPEKFGTGVIEGVAGPESANNAGSTSNFIPLLTLGMPANAVMALLLGALMIHGVRPGPMLIQENPDIFWGVVTSMYIGNVMLLVLNLPLIGIWVRLLKVPYSILFPLILFFCFIGAYSLNNNIWEVIVMIIFGILGYIMRKFKYEAAPFVFAFVLGSFLETALRQSLLMSEGSFGIFFTRPISAVLMVAGIILFGIQMMPKFKPKNLGDVKV